MRDVLGPIVARESGKRGEKKAAAAAREHVQSVREMVQKGFEELRGEQSWAAEEVADAFDSVFARWTDSVDADDVGDARDLRAVLGLTLVQAQHAMGALRRPSTVPRGGESRTSAATVRSVLERVIVGQRESVENIVRYSGGVEHGDERATLAMVLEGAEGVGKATCAMAVASALGKKLVRVRCDSRVSEASAVLGKEGGGDDEGGGGFPSMWTRALLRAATLEKWHAGSNDGGGAVGRWREGRVFLVEHVHELSDDAVPALLDSVQRIFSPLYAAHSVPPLFDPLTGAPVVLGPEDLVFLTCRELPENASVAGGRDALSRVLARSEFTSMTPRMKQEVLAHDLAPRVASAAAPLATLSGRFCDRLWREVATDEGMVVANAVLRHVAGVARSAQRPAPLHLDEADLPLTLGVPLESPMPEIMHGPTPDTEAWLRGIYAAAYGSRSRTSAAAGAPPPPLPARVFAPPRWGPGIIASLASLEGHAGMVDYVEIAERPRAQGPPRKGADAEGPVVVAVVTSPSRRPLTTAMTASAASSVDSAVTAVMRSLAWHERAAAHLGSHDFHVSFTDHSMLDADGSSGALAIAVALASLALGVPVRPRSAATGSLALSGAVLQVGGVADKLIAAARLDISTVVLPAAAVRDWAAIDPSLRDQLPVPLFANHLVDALLQLLDFSAPGAPPGLQRTLQEKRDALR